MGFLGPQGTHSEAAAIHLNGLLSAPVELVACPEIYSAMQGVADGELDSCLVPVENSLEGSINVTLDMLAHSDTLAVSYELVWDIHNQLMAKDSDAVITKIYSHAQPLSQCHAYLKRQYPQAQLVAMPSTAKAARYVAESGEPGTAAICTKRAGSLYGLSVVAEEIQDNMTNCTRFFRVCRRERLVPEKVDKALVICQIDGSRAGSLCEVLQEYAARGVNMTRIESRPARTELGAYIFFFELEPVSGMEKMKEAIEAVRQKSFWLKETGEFPVVYATKH